jgi:hypothetical protein
MSRAFALLIVVLVTRLQRQVPIERVTAGALAVD